MESTTRNDLLAMIREKAYRTGDFTLASGQKSDYYIDCKEVTLDGGGILLIGRAIWEVIKDWEVDAAGGMELGSVPISTAVCLVAAMEGSTLANFIVRKEAKGHGTGKRIEGKVGEGSRLVIVEDVVSTGGSSIKAVDAVLDAGAEVAGVISIVDREMGGAEAFAGRGVKYISLFTVTGVRNG